MVREILRLLGVIMEDRIIRVEESFMSGGKIDHLVVVDNGRYYKLVRYSSLEKPSRKLSTDRKDECSDTYKAYQQTHA